MEKITNKDVMVTFTIITKIIIYIIIITNVLLKFFI